MRQVNVLEIKNKNRPWLISFSLTFGGIILLTLPPAVIRWNGQIGLPIIQEYLQGELRQECPNFPVAAESLVDEICLPVISKKELQQIPAPLAQWLRILASVKASVLLGWASYRWHKELKETQYEAVEDMARNDIYGAIIQAQVQDVTGNFIQSAQAEQIKMLVPNVEGFDPRLLRDHTSYPHLKVLGGTRQGKTHTTQKLLHWLDGAKVVIAPKVNPHKLDWRNCFALIRKDHDRGTLPHQKILIGSTPDCRFATIGQALSALTQQPNAYLLVGCEHDFQAINQAYDWVLEVMVERQQTYSYPCPIEIVVDDATVVCQKVRNFGEKTKELVLLAGDVELRLWFLVHMDGMQALNLPKGNAELLENLKTIYVGQFAHKQVSRLINKASDGEEARYYLARKEYLKSLERAIMVVNQPLDPDVLDVPQQLLQGEPEAPQEIYQSQGAEPPYKWVQPEADGAKDTSIDLAKPPANEPAFLEPWPANANQDAGLKHSRAVALQDFHAKWADHISKYEDVILAVQYLCRFGVKGTKTKVLREILGAKGNIRNHARRYEELWQDLLAVMLLFVDGGKS